MSDHMRKNSFKSLKNIGKNHQNLALTECSETGTEKLVYVHVRYVVG
jgi:hypothetical protein